MYYCFVPFLNGFKDFFLSDMPKIDLWSIKKDQMEKFHKFYRKVGQ